MMVFPICVENSALKNLQTSFVLELGICISGEMEELFNSPQLKSTAKRAEDWKFKLYVEVFQEQKIGKVHVWFNLAWFLWRPNTPQSSKSTVVH